MKKGLFILLLINAIPYLSIGQIQTVFNAPSPNAQSLGVFGEFPQSGATGVPAIEVPLYTLKYRKITIPIALNYNSNLLKAAIHPGWVGLGWNLSDGGAITRVVNDKPDEMPCYGYRTHEITGDNTGGFYYNYNFLQDNYQNNYWYSSTRLDNATNDGLQYSDAFRRYATPVVTVRDYEPDEFSFSFLGYSGSFYLDENRNWKVRSDKRLRIEVSSTLLSCTDAMLPNHSHADIWSDPGFSQFTITDDQGIKYVFGGNQDAIEYSNTMFTYDVVSYVPKTWNLTSIILPNNESINFNYVRGELLAEITPATHSTGFYGYSILGQGLTFSGSLIAPSYLSSISTPIQKLKFYHSPAVELGYNPNSFAYQASITMGRHLDALSDPFSIFVNYWTFGEGLDNLGIASVKWSKLDRIDVLDNNDNLYSRFDFQYTNDATQRLKLQSIVNKSPVTGQNGAQYSFYYNTSSDPTFMLPEYPTINVDYWNYYNNRALDLSNAQNLDLSRQANPVYANVELLNKIVYPTGGYTTYEFESHTFAKQVAQPRNNPLITLANDKYAGGVRIKTISNFDALGNKTNFINYFYDNDHFNNAISHRSSGILGGTSLYTVCQFCGLTLADLPNDIRLFSSFPSSYNNNGSHIGYSEVTEQYADGSFAVSKFSNFDNGLNGEYMDEASPGQQNAGYTDDSFTSHAYERGKLLQKSVFTSTALPVTANTYTYFRINPSTEYVRGISSGKVYGSHSYPQSAWKINTYSYLPIQETSTLYNSGQPITKTTNYTYDPVTLNLVSAIETNSKGETVETNNTYPSDMVTYYGGAPSGTVYSHMVLQNVISPVIKSTVKIANQLVTEKQTNYTEPYLNIFRPSSESILYSTGLKALQQYTAYDASGNLLSLSKPGGPSESYIYDYTKVFPVAKISNANNLECYFKDFEEPTTTYIPTLVIGSGHSGNRSTNYAGVYWTPPYNGRTYVISYWYRNNGVWTYSGFRNYTLTYGVYAMSGGDAYDDIRIHPSDALMTTYTYTPAVGMTSMTDNNGRTTTYEYDSFQRLKNIRDPDGNILKHTEYHFAGQ